VIASHTTFFSIVVLVCLMTVAGTRQSLCAQVNAGVVPAREGLVPPEGVDPGGGGTYLRSAQRFFSNLVNGAVEDAASASTAPFVIANKKLNNAEELAGGLGDLAKSPAVARLRELHRNKGLLITKVELLEEPRLSRVAGRSFQPLKIDDLYLVLVRVEGDVGGEKGVFDFVIAMKDPRKPGGDPQLVGFGED